MEQNIKKFKINSHILKSGYYGEPFVFNDDGSIGLSKGNDRGFFITNKLDSSKRGMKWGRVVINAHFPEDCEYYIYIMVSDELEFRFKDKLISYDKFFNSKEISDQEKIYILSNNNSKVIKDSKDILLLGLEGRYLWLAIEIKNASKGVKIENILVHFPGDSLIKYFPEIYRKNKDSFFERFLAIFSSMNKDYQYKVDSVCDLIDINETTDRVLPLLAKWLGMDLEGNFLNNKQLRILIKNAKYLNQYKGTVQVISKVVELFIGSQPIIVEQIKVKQYTPPDDFNLYQILYGRNPYEFLVMLNQGLTEEVFYQLKSLINMFKPARSKVTIIFLSQECQIDKHCYIDINAKISHNSEGILDQNKYLDTNIILAK